jgi:hypothetical protein
MQDPRCRQLDIGSYLLEPMQRITRYPLLIKQILHYTEKSSVDSQELVECLSMAESLLKRANEAAREQDSNARMSELQNQINFEGEVLNFHFIFRYRFLHCVCTA